MRGPRPAALALAALALAGCGHDDARPLAQLLESAPALERGPSSAGLFEHPPPPTTTTSTTTTAPPRPPARPRAGRGGHRGGAPAGAGDFTATCYALTGTTASGTKAGAGKVAVDPRVIPLGSRLQVAGYGAATAADTGGKIKGYRIDVWRPSTAECMAWGRRTVRVTWAPG